MDKGIISKEFNIVGMTCTSCSMKIEDALKDLEGIIKVDVSYSKSAANVTYDSQIIRPDEISDVIEKLGYSSSLNNASISNNTAEKSAEKRTSIKMMIGIVIVAVGLYFLISNTIGFNFIPQVEQTMGYGILFVVGLLTSLHCIAMCGGINLSQCVSNNGDVKEPIKKKLKPSILYNAGRVVSYTIIGGIVGAIGSALSFSGTAKGIVVIVAGVFMLLMGLNMMNIFPWLKKIMPRLPKRLGSKIQNAKKGKGPFIVGLLNGFMPCGPLQTMQLYALGTGSFFAGAFSMLLFSLGTVPLMFAFGAISSILSSKFTKKMMLVSAMLVMVLGVIMIGRGFSQSGISTAIASQETSNKARVEQGVQLVSTDMEPNVYEPLAVQAGIPVRWTINVEEGDLNGCNNPVTIPKYGIEKKLEIGENIIEFTPTESGNLVYTCWMGMISGTIVVVPDISQISGEEIEQKAIEETQIYRVPETSEDTTTASAQEDSEAGGNASADSSSGAEYDGEKVSVDEVAIAQIIDGVQTVTMDVNELGFAPAIIIMQKDIQTRWIINGEKLDSCNNTLIFPSYDAQLKLVPGENPIDFIPKIDFSFSCWMGMLNGYVKVVDDINNIDIEAIKNELEQYLSPSGGGCCG